MKTRKTALVFSSVAAFALIVAAVCSAQQFNPQQETANTGPAQGGGLLQPIPAADRAQAPERSPFAQNSVVRTGETNNATPQNQQSGQPHTIQPKAPETFQLKGRFHLVSGTRTGYLILRAEIPEGSYIYSLTNGEGPPPSEVTVAPGTTFRTGEKFESDRHPIVIEHDEDLDCRLEKHYRLVQFYVPIEIAEGVDPATIRPEITFNGQVCSTDGFCMPLRNKKVAADFAGYFEQQAQEQTDTGTRR